MGRRAMSFERLTDAGPKGREATIAEGKSPQPLGVAFVRSTNQKGNCRPELKQQTAGVARVCEVRDQQHDRGQQADEVEIGRRRAVQPGSALRARRQRKRTHFGQKY